MAKDKQKVEVTDTVEAMKKLGVSYMEVPPDDDMSDMEGTPTKETMSGTKVDLTGKPTQDASGAQTGVEPYQTMPPVENVPETPPETPENALEGNPDTQPSAQLTPEQLQAKLTDLEEKRRGWQSKASQYETQVKELENQKALLQQVALQNRAISQLVGNQAQQPSQPTAPKEPKLSDYVAQDELEDIHVLDPRYQKWQQDREQWLMDNTMQRAISQFSEQQRKQQQQQMTEARAQKLAREFPEFTDPLTGQPDYVKIQNWMQEFDSSGDDSWVNLRRFQDYAKQSGNGNGKPATPIDPVQIERAAQSPTSVATAPAAATPVQKEVPPAVRKMESTFGYWEEPPE